MEEARGDLWKSADATVAKVRNDLSEGSLPHLGKSQDSELLEPLKRTYQNLTSKPEKT